MAEKMPLNLSNKQWKRIANCTLNIAFYSENEYVVGQCREITKVLREAATDQMNLMELENIIKGREKK